MYPLNAGETSNPSGGVITSIFTSDISGVVNKDLSCFVSAVSCTWELTTKENKRTPIKELKFRKFITKPWKPKALYNIKKCRNIINKFYFEEKYNNAA